MVKRKALLGGFIGAIIGVGLFVLAIYLTSIISSGWAFVPLSIGAWLIAGFVAGLIATSPSKGAIAGLLVTVFTFLLNSIVMILATVIGGAAIFGTFFAIATLGQAESIEIPSEVLIILILIGLLIALIFSLISMIFNVAAGAIGGLIRNPNKVGKEPTY